MKFRHEWKHEINKGDYYELRARLSSIAYPDKNGINGRYIVRSLYFDDLNDTALMEKINGVSKREKFRIRYYDYDKSFIHLEKKAKIDKLCCKTSEVISEEQVNKILNGDTQWMLDCEKPLIRELYYKIKNNGVKPNHCGIHKRCIYVPCWKCTCYIGLQYKNRVRQYGFFKSKLCYNSGR